MRILFILPTNISSISLCLYLCIYSYCPHLSAMISNLNAYALPCIFYLQLIFEAITRLTFLKRSSNALLIHLVFLNLFPMPSKGNEKSPSYLLHLLSQYVPSRTVGSIPTQLSLPPSSFTVILLMVSYLCFFLHLKGLP